jgi:hypothetical protein
MKLIWFRSENWWKISVQVWSFPFDCKLANCKVSSENKLILCVTWFNFFFFKNKNNKMKRVDGKKLVKCTTNYYSKTSTHKSAHLSEVLHMHVIKIEIVLANLFSSRLLQPMSWRTFRKKMNYTLWKHSKCIFKCNHLN